MHGRTKCTEETISMYVKYRTDFHSNAVHTVVITLRKLKQKSDKAKLQIESQTGRRRNIPLPGKGTCSLIHVLSAV
jgi:hypothetical protein